MGEETWNEVNNMRFFEFVWAEKKNMSGLSCQGRFLWMDGVFFLSLFCEWKTTGKSSIKANSLPRYDWLLRPKLHLRLLGSWLPGLWLANRGDRDFIHKPVYSSGQRQEIRALEEEIHQSRVSLDRARKARLHITPKSSMLEKWQHSWRSKSPHFGINFI